MSIPSPTAKRWTADATRCWTTAWDSCLVPWRPVIEERLGQQLAATARGGSVSWGIGRQRGPAIG
ncbi:DUF3363 domain-containing protein [Paraburkholderia nemoris]